MPGRPRARGRHGCGRSGDRRSAGFAARASSRRPGGRPRDGPLPRRAAPRPAAGRLRHHAAEGQLRRSGRGIRHLCGRLERRTGWRRDRCGSRCRSRCRSRCSRPTARPGGQWCTRAPAGSPACITGRTTTARRAGSPPAEQSMDHPVADHARAVMQVAAAGTGVRLPMARPTCCPPAARHAVGLAGPSRLVRRSLRRGFYQGWDLHPLQLVSRYAARYAFFRDGLPAAAARLRAYLEEAPARRGCGAGRGGGYDPGAGRGGGHDPGVLGEPAGPGAAGEPGMAARWPGRRAVRAWPRSRRRSGRGRTVRGLDCGAVPAAQLTALTGLDPAGPYAVFGRRDPMASSTC